MRRRTSTMATRVCPSKLACICCHLGNARATVCNHRQCHQLLPALRILQHLQHLVRPASWHSSAHRLKLCLRYSQLWSGPPARQCLAGIVCLGRLHGTCVHPTISSTHHACAEPGRRGCCMQTQYARRICRRTLQLCQHRAHKHTGLSSAANVQDMVQCIRWLRQ